MDVTSVVDEPRLPARVSVCRSDRHAVERQRCPALLAFGQELGEGPGQYRPGQETLTAKPQVRPGWMENRSGAFAAQRMPRVMAAIPVRARG
jgi:hypothetical protein